MLLQRYTLRNKCLLLLMMDDDEYSLRSFDVGLGVPGVWDPGVYSSSVPLPHPQEVPPGDAQ